MPQPALSPPTFVSYVSLPDAPTSTGTEANFLHYYLHPENVFQSTIAREGEGSCDSLD